MTSLSPFSTAGGWAVVKYEVILPPCLTPGDLRPWVGEAFSGVFFSLGGVVGEGECPGWPLLRVGGGGVWSSPFLGELRVATRSVDTGEWWWTLHMGALLNLAVFFQKAGQNL